MVDDGRRTDGRTTDGRTPDHGHPISSPCEPDGSGELITQRPTYFSLHPINCNDKNVQTRLFVRLCCVIKISKFETF